TKFFASFGRSAALCCAALFTAASASLGVNGVCCIPNLTCAIADPAICEGAGGVYRGDNTTCSPVNPCELPRGACCIATSKVTLPAYTGGGGGTMMTYKWLVRMNRINTITTSGSGRSLPIFCVPPPETFAGPFNFENDPIICVVIPEINCTTNDGEYHGNNTACTPSLCAPPEDLLGACCILSSNGAPQC